MRDHRTRRHLDLATELPTHHSDHPELRPWEGTRSRAQHDRHAQHDARHERHAIHQALHDVARGEDPDHIDV